MYLRDASASKNILPWGWSGVCILLSKQMQRWTWLVQNCDYFADTICNKKTNLPWWALLFFFTQLHLPCLQHCPTLISTHDLYEYECYTGWRVHSTGPLSPSLQTLLLCRFILFRPRLFSYSQVGDKVLHVTAESHPITARTIFRKYKPRLLLVSQAHDFRAVVQEKFSYLHLEFQNIDSKKWWVHWFVFKVQYVCVQY